MIRVLLADDHVIVRTGLKEILEGTGDITVTGEAGTGHEVLGLTLETVSRLFSRFQRDGLLKVHQRDVELRNAARLREIVG